MENINTEKILNSHMPIPMCIVSDAGKIVGANDRIENVFAYVDINETDFFALTGIKLKDVKTAAEKKDGSFVIERNGKKFRVEAELVDGEEKEKLIIVFFYDITDLKEMQKKYDDEKICICKINIDNFDQFNDAVSPETGMAVTTEVNTMIRKWAHDIEGNIDRLKESQYVIHFRKAFLEGLTKDKFSLLDQVRMLETSVDFPLSLSIGVGVGGETLEDTAGYAAAAMDLALGRGGDQAVIKDESRIQYYGGKTQSVEKSNKGKSRVVGHALKKLMEDADHIFIMGHKHADIDAFGSSLGIYRMSIACKAEASIVIDEVPESLKKFYTMVSDADKYQIIGTEQALKKITPKSMVVVLDTHRPSYIEAPEILTKTDKIVVIDHHRRAEEAIDSPTLAYIESYASSTAELVTEILQYILNRKTLVKMEAEALLAGMTVDTNRFAVKTGVRTFEAAAWLRRSGADTAEVKRFFQTDQETFKIKADAIANADFRSSGIATAVCKGENADAQVINSQVADDLLDIKGIKATFVASKNDRNITCVSARSLGDINVQVILEELGGGGHLNIAGAQVSESPEEIIQKIVEIVEKGE